MRVAGRTPDHSELLKPLGNAAGQFGKDHLGDRNEYLPMVHGFDEFFGNLCHLNAEEEPELRQSRSRRVITGRLLFHHKRPVRISRTWQ